jgi:hypothetical protein
VYTGNKVGDTKGETGMPPLCINIPEVLKEFGKVCQQKPKPVRKGDRVMVDGVLCVFDVESASQFNNLLADYRACKNIPAKTSILLRSLESPAMYQMKARWVWEAVNVDQRE